MVQYIFLEGLDSPTTQIVAEVDLENLSEINVWFLGVLSDLWRLNLNFSSYSFSTWAWISGRSIICVDSGITGCGVSPTGFTCLGLSYSINQHPGSRIQASLLAMKTRSKLYLFGGMTEFVRADFNDMWIFDVTSARS
jgi:hypothetical protein